MATPNELLERLEARFILGDIDQKHYEELKAKLLAKPGASSSGGSSAPVTDGQRVKSPWLTRPGRSPMPTDKGDEKPNGSTPSSAADASIPPGAMLGEQFRVEGILGRGALGSVYKVFDTVLERERAIKVVFPEQTSADIAFKQLVREFDARDRIRDFTHILRTDSPQLCVYHKLKAIVLPMPLAEKSMRDWLNQRPERDDKVAYEAWLAQTMGLFRQSCEGVKAIHDCGLIHLDLKPENLLLVHDRNELIAQVADFGLARATGQDGNRGSGTLAYMSPEQFTWRPKDIGPESDVYALGCMLFEIIDGTPPFEGSTSEEYRRMHSESEPPMYRWEHVRPEWRDVVQHCLNKQPSDRFKNASELLSSAPMINNLTVSFRMVECPICGQQNHEQDTFKCDQCGRNYICTKHSTEKTGCCDQCSQRMQKSNAVQAHAEPGNQDAILLYYESDKRWLLVDLNGNPIKDMPGHPLLPLFWLPDGDNVVCLENQNDLMNQTINVMSMSTGATRVIGVAESCRGIATLSSDGKKIVFGQHCSGGPNQIFLHDLEGHQTIQIGLSSWSSECHLSPDNLRIILYWYRNPDMSGGNKAIVRDIAAGPSADVSLGYVEVLFWLSPVDVVCLRPSDRRFIIINIHEPSDIKVIGGCLTGTRPVLSPQKTWIAYNVFQTGIFIMRPDGSDLRPICYCSNGDELNWAPDGERLAHIHGEEPDLVIDNVLTGEKTSFRVPKDLTYGSWMIGWKPPIETARYSASSSRP